MESPEDLEKALARLMPSAISGKGQRSMEDLIDSLAAGETVATVLPEKKPGRGSWLGGIGAAAAAVVIAMNLPQGGTPDVVELPAADATAPESGVVLIGQSEVVEEAVPEGRGASGWSTRSVCAILKPATRSSSPVLGKKSA
jgi:hypothetical protein